MATILVEERACACCGGPWQYVLYYLEHVGSFRPGFEPVLCARCSDRLGSLTPAERTTLFAGFPLEENPTLASVMGAGRMELKPKVDA